MELNEYQRLAKETAVYDHERDSITYPILGLCNETGEVAGKLKKWKRGDYNDFSKDLILKMIADELGDVFWYLAATADDLGYTLEEIAQMNLDKLKNRKEKNVLKGDGDTR